MINSPRTNSVIDFNVYNIYMHEFTIDPADNQIFNAPCVLDSVFTFKNTVAEDANKAIQTLIIAKNNIIYTREYDFTSKAYSEWYSITDAVGVVISDLRSKIEAQQGMINDMLQLVDTHATSLAGINEVFSVLFNDKN